MARRGARAKPKRGNATNPLAQLGLFNIPDLDALGDDEGGEDDFDDGDLEAELSALLTGQIQPKKQKRPPKQPLDLDAIQKIATAAIDDDASDDDANLSDDPDLVAELHKLAPPSGAPQPSAPPDSVPVAPPRHESLGSPEAAGEPGSVASLQVRLQNYREAETAAKAMGDSSKARRYNRAIKTLEGMIKQVQAGGTVDEEEIPPPVAVPKPPSSSSSVPAAKVPKYDRPVEADSGAPLEPTPDYQPPEPTPVPVLPVPPRPALRPAPQPPPPVAAPQSSTVAKTPPVPPRPRPTATLPAPEPSSSETTEQMLISRRDQYKHAAVLAKKQGDIQTALKYVKTAKEFDAVRIAMANGQPVDLSKMPPPPSAFANSPASVGSVPPTAPNPPTPAPVLQASTGTEKVPSYLDENVQDNPDLFKAPPPPTSVMEALQQRLEKFQGTANEAKEQGNSSKARRIGRIVKQYEDAIKMYKAGKPIDFEELPAPPGFGPIPVPSEAANPAKPPAAEQAPKPPAPKPVPKPAPKPASATSPPSAQPKKPMRRTVSTTMDKQMQFLKERQRLFRDAAIEAKRRGDVEQAKEYLRMMKGLDPMIQATECGLPIDATSIPVPPQLQEDFVVLEASECQPSGTGEIDEEEFRTIERELIDQHQMCLNNKDHFFKLGDVASGTKFEKLAQEAHRDLLVVRNLWKKSEPLPKFHYETRVFTIVRSHLDLGDNDLEVSIIRGVNLPGKPDDLDSYIMVTFPFPSDAPQSSRTRTVKDTNNPEYNETFKYEVNRKSRAFARVLKRHPIKMEIWSKRGILRSDAMIGLVNVKFEELESKCEIHDSFDVFDGKKPTRGKLEVKIRVREPFVSKQVEEIKQRWLIIGS